MVGNAMLAVAAGRVFGLSLEECATGLTQLRLTKGRLEQKMIRGIQVIDDTYNANPDSVKAAIAVLAHAAGPKWLVLGDMGEVGDRGPLFHREVGDYARAVGIDRLLTVGELATHAVAAFGPGGKHFADQDSLVHELNAVLERGTTVLVKGSRFMEMERVVERLGELRELTAGRH
jgi:UDP-N-acetylmuramoyl-tripeptide--D-alanyl-D-alanine ligase